MQTEKGMSPKDFTAAKKKLNDRLQTLKNELDNHQSDIDAR